MNSELSFNHVETQTMQAANADCADGAVTRRGGKRKHIYYFNKSQARKLNNLISLQSSWPAF